MSQHTNISQQFNTTPASAAANVLPVQEPLLNDIDMESLQRLPVQRKLSIGSPDDPLEHEADAIADRVMRMPESSFIQRKCAECEEEEKLQRKPLASSVTPFIQAKESVTASDSVSQKINSTRGGGSSMDSGTKSFMESRFGTDFSDVKIHTGSYSSQMSKELNAQAFTTGSDIYFNSGKYDTSSNAGKHLLAHELTHTLQQGNNSLLQNKLIQLVPFAPWPGQTGSDVAGTYSATDGIIRERVQRTGDPNFAAPMPSLLEFDPANRTLRSTMQINFIQETNADNALTTEQFDSLKARILQVGNERLNGWIVIHTGSEASCPANCQGEDISVQIVAEEGTGTYAQTVMLGRSYGTEDAGHIGDSSSDWTVWHEMGHIVLGAADEYAAPGRPDERVNESDYSIMASSSSYGRMGMLHSRHFSHLAAWLTRRYSGCTFTIVESVRPIVIDWSPELMIGGFGGRSSGLYYSLGVNMGIPLDDLRRFSVIIGPRFNLALQFDDGVASLLAGIRAGIRFRTPGLLAFESSVFGEGGGVGFTNLETGAFGGSPYGEGGVSLGGSYLPFNFGLEAAGGGRTATTPADLTLGTPAGTEFQPYFRLGLTFGLTL